MVGYGPEDNHFVAELTYNYGVGDYRLGNDFLVSTSSCVLHRLIACNSFLLLKLYALP